MQCSAAQLSAVPLRRHKKAAVHALWQCNYPLHDPCATDINTVWRYHLRSIFQGVVWIFAVMLELICALLRITMFENAFKITPFPPMRVGTALRKQQSPCPNSATYSSATMIMCAAKISLICLRVVRMSLNHPREGLPHRTKSRKVFRNTSKPSSAGVTVSC